MNVPQRPVIQTAQVHRNLESLATVATPATALCGVAYSRCHPIKKVATTGNAHLIFNIRAPHFPFIWLSLLPVKNRWQQFGSIGNACRPRFTGLLPLLPLLPVFLKSQEHWITGNPAEVTP
ncbi:hypothetical protein HX780_07800 [Pseudomonas tolaasii]|uniref:hypothetical protein n=1 Tax=Pseudomonas tolaasii TaxID=29442 RepID=UPI0015A11C1C|nr:hypothetical protein [Pseudomonas tolaasii]NVZ47745.1 hypothetical protein [Pseudomonas tolaasii]NWA48197.1 hypothetical protein [Pseudomonas tolaasii]